MKKEFILLGFGILFCLVGTIYLAVEFVPYMSEGGILASLLLTVVMLIFLGKHFEELGR